MIVLVVLVSVVVAVVMLAIVLVACIRGSVSALAMWQVIDMLRPFLSLRLTLAVGSR